MVKTQMCQVESMSQMALRLNPSFEVPFRFSAASRARARTISSWLNIQLGRMFSGRSGSIRKAPMAMGNEITASMMKIQRQPARPATPLSVLWTPPWRTWERRLPRAHAPWKRLARLPSSSLEYHEPMRKSEEPESGRMTEVISYSLNHRTHVDRGSMHSRRDRQRNE